MKKRYDIITIFPDAITPYTTASILGRAQRNNHVRITAHDLRDYTTDTHRTVDDTPYGGGAGMVLKVEPFDRAVRAIRNRHASVRTIVLSAKGRAFTQNDAHRLAQYDQVILLCGRYEGIDERVAEHIADEELRIGDYVLTGGELGALVIVDSIVRLLPGVLGNAQSAEQESHSKTTFAEHPHYTAPAEYNGWTVPDVLRSGDHAAIARWREEHSTPQTPSR